MGLGYIVVQPSLVVRLTDHVGHEKDDKYQHDHEQNHADGRAKAVIAAIFTKADFVHVSCQNV